MKYHIKKINRTVELDDKILKYYTQMTELHDSVFLLSIRHKYGGYPSNDISDEELSLLCNNTMISELETAMFIPEALDFIKKHPEFKNSKQTMEVELS